MKLYYRDVVLSYKFWMFLKGQLFNSPSHLLFLGLDPPLKIAYLTWLVCNFNLQPRFCDNWFLWKQLTFYMHLIFSITLIDVPVKYQIYVDINNSFTTGRIRGTRRNDWKVCFYSILLKIYIIYSKRDNFKFLCLM